MKTLIVGAETLPIRCAEILLAEGHEVLGVASPNPQVVRWAADRSIPNIASGNHQATEQFVLERGIDVLFSVYNDLVLPKALIEAPRLFSVNYHDGPLPRYAGPNAGAWALLNDERQHGVCWHIMTTNVDAGDILASEDVAILPNDSAFTLNGRCYEAALSAFRRLAKALADGTISRTPQETSERTYYRRSLRPTGFGIIDWNSPAEQIENMVRSLDFGPYYPNRFASAKLGTGRDFVMVGRASPLKHASDQPPGTVIRVSDEGLQIASSTTDLLLSDFRTLAGTPVLPIDVLRDACLHSGDQLPSIQSAKAEAAKVLAERIARHENFWFKRLQSLEPLRLDPVAPRPGETPASSRIEIPETVIAHLPKTDGDLGEVVLALAAVFLTRFVRGQEHDVGVRPLALAKLIAPAPAGLFASYLPVRIAPDFNADAACNVELFLEASAKAAEHETYALDVIGRLRLSSEEALVGDGGCLPVSLAMVDGDLDACPHPSGCSFWIAVAADGTRVLFRSGTREESDTVAVLATSFQAFLADLAARPDAPLGSLSIISQDEQDILLTKWNATEVEMEKNLCIHELFERQVRKTPDATAVVRGSERVSYAELNRRANRLAHHLAAQGVGPEVCVGVFMERSIEMVTALMAVLKSGGAYVPLDPDHPAQRIQSVLEEIDAPVILTQAHLKDRLPEGAPTAHFVDEIDASGKPYEDTDLATAVSDHNLAYVIYTSGSTGRPKGAMNEHRGVCNRLLWMQMRYKIDTSDRVLQKTPYSFDVSVWEFFWPLMTGASLVMAEPGGHRDPVYLAETIAAHGITTLHFVPSMLRAFLDEPNLGDLSSVRRVFCSGEALPLDLHDRFFERLDAKLHNLYGPTEAAIDVTFWECRPDTTLQRVPIGSPVANTSIFVLDERLQPLPIGVTGELFIGGVQVGRGYLNRSDLTTDRFLPNPFGEAPEERLYRTGDLARFRGDGAVEYLGRTDHQVKIRGLRIELEEIETALLDHTDVQNAVVIAHRDARGDEQLVAYVVPQEASEEKLDIADEGSEKLIDSWRKIYDENYGAPQAEVTPGGDYRTWISSYTGAPFPTAEMDEWAIRTVERISALRPGRVLEIGCGMGLLLFRLAPGCENYVATDLSDQAIDYVRSNLDSLPPGSAKVELYQGEARDFSALGSKKFDTIIVNSVAQYFPSLDYLVDVIEEAIRRTEDGGAVFLGDLRNLTLLEAFHTSVDLAHAAPDTTKSELADRVRRRMAREQELLLDPLLFPALRARLPRIRRVRIQTKASDYQNEMSKFRYDVVLEIGPEVEAVPDAKWTPWQVPDNSLDVVADQFSRPDVSSRGFSDVPNMRTSEDFAALDWLNTTGGPTTVSEWHSAKDNRVPDGGLDPDAFRSLADEIGLDTEIRWTASSNRTFDVLLWPRGAERPDFPTDKVSAAASLKAFANDPMASARSDDTVSRFRRYLAEQLPDYMVPKNIIVMDELVLSPNGKLDRKALPAPEATHSPERALREPPRTAVEAMLAEAWEETLGHPVGVTENFFDAGGDSLKAIRLILAIEERFDQKIRLDDLFNYPSIEALASVFDGPSQQATEDCLVTIHEGQTDAVPLFLVHDADGETILYRHLAERLDSARTTYGLRPPRLPEASIEETAATFMRAIREVQPHGPYLLGGLCAGGVLAAEMAMQLRDAGEEVPLVAALDAVDARAPLRNVVIEARVQRLRTLISETSQHDDLIRSIGRLAGAISKRAANVVAYEVESLWRRIRQRREYSRFSEQKLSGTEDLTSLTTRELFNLAVQHYNPRHYDGTIALFRATKAVDIDTPGINDTPLRGTTDDPAFGWRSRCTGQVKVFDAEGGHSSMLQPPYVDSLARELNRCIEQALAGSERAHTREPLNL